MNCDSVILRGATVNGSGWPGSTHGTHGTHLPGLLSRPRREAHFTRNRGLFRRSRLAALLLMVVMTSCTTSHQSVALFTIGDSTMARKKAEVYPETGWCEALPPYLRRGVLLHNHAVNGRSTKSFLTEGRWQQVADSLKKGDFVFIQFGHNDQKIQDTTRYTDPRTTFRDNLGQFIRESRERGALPVLFTPIVRRKFDEAGRLTPTHGEYPEAVREVSAAWGVPLIDLEKLTARKVQKAGPKKSKQYYLWTAPDQKFPEGRKDDTHLNRKGAAMVASLAAKALKKQKVKVVNTGVCPDSRTVWRSPSWNGE